MRSRLSFGILMSKPTPNQFGGSKICYHEIFVFSNNCTHKDSPLPLLLCYFWVMTGNLELRDNRSQTQGDRMLTPVNQVKEKKEYPRRKHRARARKRMNNRNQDLLLISFHLTYKPKISTVPATDGERMTGLPSAGKLQFKRQKSFRDRIK